MNIARFERADRRIAAASIGAATFAEPGWLRRWFVHSGSRPDVAPAPTRETPDFHAILGAAAWARLAPDIRRRFARTHATPVYRGALSLRCSPIGFVFAVLSRPFGAPLPTIRTCDTEAEVVVSPDGQGGVVWARSLRTRPDGPAILVRSRKRIDSAGTVTEETDGGLGMELRVFEDEGALVFESRRYFLSLGHGWRIPLPALMTPGRCRVSHCCVDATRFRFTMTMTHPIWGETFRQSGIFEETDMS